MPKFVKCPRCEINYMLDDQEYCEICQEELRGISHNEVLEEVDEAEICPRCRINFLNEGEKVCEACAAELEVEVKPVVIGDVEPDWDITEEVVDEADLVDEVDLVDDEVELSLEDLAEEEAFDEEDEEIFPDDEEFEELDLDSIEDLPDDEEDEEDE